MEVRLQLFDQLFHRLAGEYKEVDYVELGQILNIGLKRGELATSDMSAN